ncbi:MAG: hypothetical protein WAW63_02275 [Candidatus Saccharimonadales bacterium]
MDTPSDVPEKTRLSWLHMTKKRVIIIATLVSLLAITFGVVFSAMQQTTAKKSTAAGTQFIKSAETYVMSTLPKAILKAEAEDSKIVNKANDSRPAPPPSLDTVLTKEQRTAMNAPYVLPYEMSAKSLASHAPPKLAAIPDGAQKSAQYAKAEALQTDLQDMYKKIGERYAAENCSVEVRNAIMALNMEITDKEEAPRRSDAIGVKELYEEELPIFEKYYAQIVNDQTKVCLTNSKMRIFDSQFANIIKQRRYVATQIGAGVRGEPLHRPILSSVNSYKEIVAMQLSLSISSFNQTKVDPKTILYDFAVEQFPYLKPDIRQFMY